jgi:hypothetical protein
MPKFRTDIDKSQKNGILLVANNFSSRIFPAAGTRIRPMYGQASEAIYEYLAQYQS